MQGVHRLHALAAGRSSTVPVLVTPGRVLTESSDIVAWAAPGLFPPERDREVRTLEAGYDEELGPAGRLWMYFHLRDHRRLALRYNLVGVPRWEAAAMTAAFPLFMRLVDRVLDVTAEAADAAEAELRRIFDATAERLADGRPYLAGERFTAADLAFAALSAPAVVPPEYGVALPTPGELPPRMRGLVEELRAHPAGRHALRMYREERRAAAPRS